MYIVVPAGMESPDDGCTMVLSGNVRARRCIRVSAIRNPSRATAERYSSFSSSCRVGIWSESGIAFLSSANRRWRISGLADI